jgi:uncharacterized protein
MNESEITKILREAVKASDIEKVRSLISQSKDRLHQMTPFGTWLHIAAKGGYLDLIHCLISMGADVNAKGGTFGGSPVNLAAGFGQELAVRALLSAGATLDTSESVRNPLFSAIQGGHLETVKLLIENGIDYKVRYSGESMKDMGALEFAQERGEMQIVDYLRSLRS